MLQSKSLQDEMLKAYIDKVFDKYDTDRNGTLDSQEMTHFFNDLFRSLSINVTVTEQQAVDAIRSIDDNSDGVVSKEELFKAFKAMLNPYFHPYAGRSSPPATSMAAIRTRGTTSTADSSRLLKIMATRADIIRATAEGISRTGTKGTGEDKGTRTRAI